MAKREIILDNLPDNYELSDVAAALVFGGNADVDPVAVYKQLQEQDKDNNG
jgi:hypothetical protein